MDHKWLWKKKSSEKTILATDKANITSKENEEVLGLLVDKEELERKLKRLNDKLALTLSDCNAKDEQLKEQTKIAQEAVAGWKKAEAEMLSMKQYLDESMPQQVVHEERVAHLDGALKECKQQLRVSKEEQEQRVQDAVMKASKEFEQAHLVLEKQLSETSKRLAKSRVENSLLNKSVLSKENLIEDLKRQLVQAEGDHNALMIRLESSEKDNASLKYEVRVLEKELDILSEEREFNRRTADASHKQHLENFRKIAKLESECQRLRLLVRKRLPGTAALLKMKNEVEMLGQDPLEMRRKILNSTGLTIESSVDISPETTIRTITTLTKELCAMEEENKTLKESLKRKTNEVQFSRAMLARTVSKLLQLQSQIEESSIGQVTSERHRSNLASHEFSSISMSGIGSDDDKVSCAESWASALISELEHFRSGKQKESLSCQSIGASDMNLMDDFVEMEKLAVVSVGKTPEISHASIDADNGINGFSETRATEITSEEVGKEIINPETCSNDTLTGNIPGWLQKVVKVVLEQNCVTPKNADDIILDIRLALSYLNSPQRCGLDLSKGPGHFDESNPPHFIQHISFGPLNDTSTDPSSEVNDADISAVKKSQTDLSKSIGKIIELIEGISLPAEDYDNKDLFCRRDGNSNSYNNLGMPAGYMVRIFQWKTSELGNILQQFLHVCYDLLKGKADLEKLARQLAAALDWIMNHCFSLQDVSSMRDAIKKEFDLDETRSENEAEIGMISHCAESDKPHGDDLQTEEMQNDEKEEFRNVKNKVISSESDKEVNKGRLQLDTDRIEPLVQESEKTAATLRLKLQTSGVLADQIQTHTFINEDLDTQITEAKSKEAYHKIFALEVELENKNHYCEELETRCVELQLLLESMKKECSSYDDEQKDKTLQQTNWEITAAPEKLAGCQETILHLGRPLKASATPKDALLFDNVIGTKRRTNINTSTAPLQDMKVKNRSSLLDQMLAEDTNAKVHRASDRSSSPTSISGIAESLEKILVLKGREGQDDSATVNSMAIVSVDKSGRRNLWKKLLGRRKLKRKHQFSLAHEIQF